MTKKNSLNTMIASREIYTLITEKAPFSIVVTNTKEECIYSNAEYQRITGFTAKELHGSGWLLTIHPDDRTKIFQNTVLNQHRVIHRNGNVISVQTRSSHIYDEKDQRGYVRIFEDITLRLKMENQLRINFAAMESSASMIMITNKAGFITWINAAFTQGTGYSYDEAIGRNPRFLASTSHSPVKKVLKKIISTGETGKLEVYNRRKDGTIYLEEEIITPVIDSEGNISHFLAIKNDITEKRENERKVKEYSEHLEELVLARTQALEEAQRRLLIQQRLEQDLEIAIQIQQNLLPDKPPKIPFFDIASKAFAARYISGDLYDYIQTDPQTLFILIADISGKGIPAALLSASARTTVREKILQKKSPAEILDLVNQTLYSDLDKTEMFITMILARLDINTGLWTYSNAGHTQTVYYQAASRKTNFLGPTSFPIGISPDLKATENKFYLNPEDILFIYSDGLTEATDKNGNLLGEKVLANSILLNSKKSSLKILNSVINIVDTFSGYEPPSDDRSIIIIKKNKLPYNYTFEITSETFDDIIQVVRKQACVFGESFASECEIVITELLTNIIRHAYGIDIENLEDSKKAIVQLEFHSSTNGIIFDIYDYGVPFVMDPYYKPEIHHLQEGGYGYYLINKLTDTVTYIREQDNKNHWHLEKKGALQ